MPGRATLETPRGSPSRLAIHVLQAGSVLAADSAALRVDTDGCFGRMPIVRTPASPRR